MATAFDAEGHSRMSASVMAGIAGVKAAVGAIAGACCRLRAAAPEAMARAAVVAAMSFIAVFCGSLQKSRQAVSPTAQKTKRSRNSRQVRAAEHYAGLRQRRLPEELRLRGGPLPPPDLTARHAHLSGGSGL